MSIFKTATQDFIPMQQPARSLDMLTGNNIKSENQASADEIAKAKEFASELFRMLVKNMMPKDKGMMGSGQTGEVFNDFYVDAIVDASKGNASYGIETGVLRTLMKNQEVSNGTD